MSLVKRALELKKTNPLRKRIQIFLSRDDNFGKYHIYEGRSKKIKRGRVIIIEDKGDKVKVKDVDGNEAIVSKSTLSLTMF